MSRIVLLGRTALLRSCIQECLRCPAVELSLVLVAEHAGEIDDHTAHFCAERRISCMRYRTVQDAALLALIRDIRPQILLSIYNGQIIGPELLEQIPTVVNFHDGPLPRYAGLNAPCWALLNGESQHGVTWHRVRRRIDAGEILLQARFAIEPAWGILELISACGAHGRRSFRELLPALLAGTCREQQQELSARSYYSSHSKPFDGCLPLERGVVALNNLARATAYFPMPNPFVTPYAFAGDERLELLRFAGVADASVTATPGRFIGIDGPTVCYAAGGGRLVLEKLRTHDGQIQTAAEWAHTLRALPAALGDIHLP